MPELNAITVYTKFFTPSYFYFKMGGNAPGLSAVRLDWLVLKAILFLYSTFLSMKPGRIAESPCYRTLLFYYFYCLSFVFIICQYNII